MGAYRCGSCGYIYDPEARHHSGVSFDKMPKDWVCPACHAKKENFIMLGEEYHNQKKDFFRKRSEAESKKNNDR